MVWARYRMTAIPSMSTRVPVARVLRRPSGRISMVWEALVRTAPCAALAALRHVAFPELRRRGVQENGPAAGADRSQRGERIVRG